jgi:dipeptidyl aminopeptidase/acylaminoacyl peptidase
MLKKIILSIVVFILAVAGGLAISYALKGNREASNVQVNTHQNSSKPENTKEAPHPYTIEALRSREYPGSNIVIEQDLGDQGAFRSYVISYTSDGLKLNALMNVPDSPKPEGGFPVIVLNHGFIEPSVYDTITSYKSYMDAYSRQGFLVVKPDYRGHNDSEGEGISAHISPDYTVDVLNLVSSIKKHPDANPNKIGMWGHSMGGGITLRALAVSKDIKAAALLAGVVASPTSFYNYWQLMKDDPRVPGWIKENAARALNEFGTPHTNPDLWSAISPYSYISEFSAPIQIHHGTNDTDVPIIFSEELNNALKHANKPGEYFVYQGGDHNLAGSARGPVLTRTFDFFKSQLK